MGLSFTFHLSLPNNVLHFLILFPVIFLVSSKEQMNVITTDTINVRCGCASQQRGNELASRTSYHARQHRLCSHTRFSPPSSSHIFYCNGIRTMSRCTDPHIHGGATDHAAFQQSLSWPGYFQTQQPALLSTDLPLLPGVSEHSQQINTTDDDLIKDRKTGFEGRCDVGSGRVGRGGTG